MKQHLVKQNIVQFEISVDDSVRVEEEEPDCDFRRVETRKNNKGDAHLDSKLGFFVAVPRTSLAGLQSTVTTLPCTYYKTEVNDSPLSA